MDTQEFLKTVGYQKPYGESPVDIPEGFHGGTVDHTGGNIFCRRWRTWGDNQKAGDIGYEVIYDVSRSATVACEKYRYNEDAGYYEHLSTEMTKEAEYKSDYALAQVAQALMKSVGPAIQDDDTDESDPRLLKSRGHIVFDDLTTEDFRELVTETLNTSEFIETSIDPESGVLVINEVIDIEQ